jgi:hypothetical protein
MLDQNGPTFRRDQMQPLAIHRPVDSPDSYVSLSHYFVHPSICTIRPPSAIHSPDLLIAVTAESLESCYIGLSADINIFLEVDQIEDNRKSNGTAFIVTFAVC